MALGAIRGTVRDDFGRLVSGVSVQVNLTGGVTPAVLFSDRAGTDLTNPFNNQDDGSFEFFAATLNRYDVVFSKAGITFDNSDYLDLTVDMGADGSVLTRHVADLNITTGKLIDNAVTSVKLQSNASDDTQRAVTTNSIKDVNVTEPKLADMAVSTRATADAAITAPKLASDSVITVKILDKNVTEPKLADNSVSTRTIIDGNVTLAKLSSDIINKFSTPTSVLLIDDLLIVGVSPFNWITDGTGTIQSTVSDHYGVLAVAQNASNDTLSYPSDLPFVLPASNFDLTFIVKKTGGAGQGILVGLSSSQSSLSITPTNGIFFRVDSGGTNWFAVCRSGGAEFIYDMGVALSTNYINLRLRRVDGSTIGFSINGGTEINITSNIPTAAIGVAIQSIANSGTHVFYIDLVSLGITNLSR